MVTAARRLVDLARSDIGGMRHITRDVSDEAVCTALDLRYGDKRAIYDPSDKEANNRLTGEGFKIIHGGAFGKAAWENIRRSKAARPSGEIRPTPKPYSDDPSAPPVDLIPVCDWTEGMHEVAALAKRLAAELLGVFITVNVVNTTNGFAAAYSPGQLDLNVRRLGRKWFSDWRGHLDQVLDVLVHEFGHHYDGNHLSEGYHEALSMLAGRLAVVALERPALFEPDPL